MHAKLIQTNNHQSLGLQLDPILSYLFFVKFEMVGLRSDFDMSLHDGCNLFATLLQEFGRSSQLSYIGALMIFLRLFSWIL